MKRIGNRMSNSIRMASFAAFLAFTWSMFFSPALWAQDGKELRQEIRLGNHAAKLEDYKEAEVHYRKALQADPYNVEALYNLGGVLAATGKGKEALEEGYEPALRRANSAMQKAMIYHNIGNLFMAQKDYAAAIDAFKNSLRNEPTNNETRYNLALAQKLLKQDPQSSQQQEQQQKQDQEKKEKEEQKQEPDKQENQEPAQPEEKRGEMDKETAEQLLKAAMQDERKVQEKMKQKATSTERNYEKDW